MHELTIYTQELQKAGVSLQGGRRAYECGDQVFIHFSNIRSSCTVFSNLAMGIINWTAYSITPREFYSIVNPAAGPVTAHEAQLYITVFRAPLSVSGIKNAQQIEHLLKGVLRSEGDLFAFKVVKGAEGNLMSAVAEYCDSGMCSRAISKINNKIVGVSTYPSPRNRRQIH